MHAFLISAAHKSSGKTTVSIGLCAALHARGHAVQPFKKGPDYIDPMWLSAAAGAPCRNLDLFLSEAAEVSDTYRRHATGADVCLVEGNKGLYDGLSLDGSNSNAALARQLDIPVILVIDSRGMTRGIAPLILGYQAFDPQVRISGVILNRVGGKRHEAKLRAVIEHYTQVPVIGAVPEDPRLGILERHLGLVPSNEAGDAANRIAELGAIIAEYVDLDRLLELTVGAGPASVRLVGESARKIPTRGRRKPAARTIRVGIARDRAFGFYYPDDLEAMVAAGAELVPFDTLRDAELPDVDALFIGGGFPESFAAELSANVSLRSEIAAAIDAGMPVHAECGGLMYLTRSLSWRGETHAMVGAIAADTVMRAKPVGRGYVILEASAEHPWLAAGSSVRAHEFHYSDLENVSPDLHYAWRVKRGHGVDGRRDGIVHRNLLASYGHLRSVAGCDWAARFIDFARQSRSLGRRAITA